MKTVKISPVQYEMLVVLGKKKNETARSNNKIDHCGILHGIQGNIHIYK